MSGLPAGYFKFFKGLEKDNSKAYFEAHRAEYEEHVKEPFRELVQNRIDRIRKTDPALSNYYLAQNQRRIFLINCISRSRYGPHRALRDSFRQSRKTRVVATAAALNSTDNAKTGT